MGLLCQYVRCLVLLHDIIGHDVYMTRLVFLAFFCFFSIVLLGNSEPLFWLAGRLFQVVLYVVELLRWAKGYGVGLLDCT